MEDSNLTIKRVYDQYDHKDYNYGTLDSTNLNPKREIKFDRLDKVAARLQEITDDIIRKRIAPPREVEEVIKGAIGRESFPQGIPFKKQQALAQTGGVGNALLFPIIATGLEVDALDRLLEVMVGTYPIPELLWEFDKPIQLDCELILKKFDVEDAEDFEEWDEVSDRRSSSDSISAEDTSDDSDDGGDSDDDNNEDDDDEDEDEAARTAKECAEIELTWLKILLIIIKIIKILKMIIDLILSLIIPILEILQLAIGAWLNPPNIALIVQLIIKLVTAIIVMLITLLIQLIWNLLNLDCVADQLASIMDQIRKALSAFSSIMNAFDANAVNMFANRIKVEITNPLDEIIDQAMQKKELWANLRDEMKASFEGMTIEGLKNDLINGVLQGVMEIPEVGEVGALYAQGADIMNNSLREAKESMKNAAEGFRAMQAMFSKMPKGNDPIAAAMSHPSIENMSKGS